MCSEFLTEFLHVRILDMLHFTCIYVWHDYRGAIAAQSCCHVHYVELQCTALAVGWQANSHTTLLHALYNALQCSSMYLSLLSLLIVHSAVLMHTPSMSIKCILTTKACTQDLQHEIAKTAGVPKYRVRGPSCLQALAAAELLYRCNQQYTADGR